MRWTHVLHGRTLFTNKQSCSQAVARMMFNELYSGGCMTGQGV